MKKLLKSKEGSLSIIFIVLFFILTLFVFLIVEMGGTMESHDYAMSVLQRSCNSAVERNILDEYRADRILKMDVDQAEADFREYVADDMPGKYEVVITSINSTESPPSMTVKGSLTFPTMFSQFGFEDFTVKFTVRSTNYDLDE